MIPFDYNQPEFGLGKASPPNTRFLEAPFTVTHRDIGKTSAALIIAEGYDFIMKVAARRKSTSHTICMTHGIAAGSTWRKLRWKKKKQVSPITRPSSRHEKPGFCCHDTAGQIFLHKGWRLRPSGLHSPALVDDQNGFPEPVVSSRVILLPVNNNNVCRKRFYRVPEKRQPDKREAGIQIDQPVCDCQPFVSRAVLKFGVSVKVTWASSNE